MLRCLPSATDVSRAGGCDGWWRYVTYACSARRKSASQVSTISFFCQFLVATPSHRPTLHLPPDKQSPGGCCPADLANFLPCARWQRWHTVQLATLNSIPPFSYTYWYDNWICTQNAEEGCLLSTFSLLNVPCLFFEYCVITTISMSKLKTNF